MNLNQFTEIFKTSLEKSVDLAERYYRKQLPRIYQIELHGAGVTGKLLTPEEAIQHIYISDQLFWYVVDISVESYTDIQTTIFVRVSGHEPVSWEKTWREPAELGPFRVIGPKIDSSKILKMIEDKRKK